MNTWLAGVTGLALTVLTGGAMAQDVGARPVDVVPVEAAATGEQPGPAEPNAPSATPPTGPDAASASAAAQWEGEIPPAYLGVRTPISTSALEAWFAQPRRLLDDNPKGGRAMAQFVRSLVGTDNRTVPAVIDLAKMSDVRDAQIGAMAEGLASAMRDSEVPAPQYAAYIQWAVAQSQSNELIEAFEESSGADEDRTAAIGAGGRAGGSPGSGSLSGGGAPGISGPVGVNSTVPTSGLLTGGRGGGSVVSFDEGDTLLGGATGGLVVCTLDASPAGCQVVF